MAILAGIGGALAVLIVIGIILVNQKAKEEAARQAELKVRAEKRSSLPPTPGVGSTPDATSRAPKPGALPPPAEPSVPSKKVLVRGKEADIPLQWQRGAEGWAYPELGDGIPCEASVVEEALRLMRQGDVKKINENLERYMPAIINSLKNDDETVARPAFKTLYEICELRQWRETKTNQNPVPIEWINSPWIRGSEFNYWAGQWWPNDSPKFLKVKDPVDPAKAREVQRVDWDSLVKKLGAGGGYDDESTPQGQAFKQVKELGKAAWPKLASYLDHEELRVARGVAIALNELTGANLPLPKETDRAQIKAQWLEWISKH